MRIMITGGAGNLGSSLSDLLYDHDLLKVTIDNWNSVDSMFTKKVDAIIHCAYDLQSKIAIKPASILEANLMTTGKLLELAKRHAVNKFCFVSTCAVYGDKGNTEEVSECTPLSINGITKLLNERIIIDFCKSNNISYQIYRLFNTYGGNDKFSVLFHLKEAHEKNKTFRLNNDGQSQRDFIHVCDIAKIISQLVMMDLSNEIVNIGTGIATKLSDVVKAFVEVHGDVKMTHTNEREIEYSRANIDKLKALIDCDFVNVIDFVKAM